MSIIHNIYHTKIYILTSCKPIQLLICQKIKKGLKVLYLMCTGFQVCGPLLAHLLWKNFTWLGSGDVSHRVDFYLVSDSFYK